MNVLLPVVGVAMILAASYDIFHTLFHPMGHGSISALVMRGTWKLLRAIGKVWHRAITLAGSFLIGAAILYWATMLWVGFALIFMPLLEGAKVSGPRFIEALYRSGAYLTTMGGEVPFAEAHPFARMLVPLECAFGLGVATASISWVMSMQPILRHRRGFAHGMQAVFDAIKQVGGVSQVPASELAGALGRIAREVLQIRSDLRHTPGAYYFHAEDPQMSFVHTLPRLLEFAREAEKREEVEVKLRAKMLIRAVNNLAGTVRDHYLEHSPAREAPEKTIQRWKRDHLEA